MEFLSDFLFELILTLLFDGSVEIVKNKKLNICLRIAAAAILITVIAGILISLLIVGIIIMVKGEYLFYGAIIVALDALMIVFAIKKLVKTVKKFKK